MLYATYYHNDSYITKGGREMIGTEEMVVTITKRLFAEMQEDETEAQVLQKLVVVLLKAYESIQNTVAAA
jgi:hypothetical protein